MEYVRGEPITIFCDQRRLGIRARLHLFLQVCDGVHHAHQKGIIHRDIKPSNVIVSDVHGRPSAKIIDFGIAKAIAPTGLTGRDQQTEFGVLLGTPEYMSPEQADLGAADVDIRSDVYSLGALLYELMTGVLPLEGTELREHGLEALRRTIREKQPTRPSTRASMRNDAAARAAADRSTDAQRLASELRGDLDAVVLKSLEKERARRYGSVSDLAADVRRHLQHQPVTATVPTVAYRLRKFVRRHRLGVSAGATIALLLVVLTIASAVQSARLARERDRATAEAAKATAITRFLQDTLGAANPATGPGRDATVREALAAAVVRIDGAFAGDPVNGAAVRHTIGRTYSQLGHYAEAEQLLRSSLEARRATLGDTHPDVLDTQIALVDLLRETDRLADAETLARDAVATSRKSREADRWLPEALNQLGIVLLRRDRVEESESTFRESIELYRRRGASLDVHQPLSNLGVLLSDTGRYDEAEGLLREALEVDRKRYGDRHLDVAFDLNNLAFVHWRQKKYALAEREYGQAIELWRQVRGPDHQDVATGLNNLATLLVERGAAAEALPHYEEALRVGLKTLEPRNWLIGNFRSNLGNCLVMLGRLADAEEQLLTAYQILVESLGADNPRSQRAAQRLTSLYSKWKRPAEAARFAPLAGDASSAKD
jgi:non-specific serine/threonine protein kinase/serine/threonine-protein kinase